MKVFKIEDRRGWVAIPERIAGYSFPLSFGSKVAATQFAFRGMAERVKKKYHLTNSHIEECEFQE